MTASAFATFLDLPEQDRRDVFATTARRHDTVPDFVEKDFWVCLVLEILFNRLPGNHPRLLFKGGTSLSKGFGLIRRFSEDIDLVIRRDDLGFTGERDPIISSALSNKRRAALFKELAGACGTHVQGPMRADLTTVINSMEERCFVTPNEGADGQSLLVVYPGLWPSSETAYVQPRVKIEAGARSALEPVAPCSIDPYIADELPDWKFTVTGIVATAPERTFWEKLLILHGIHCGYRDAGRLPSDSDRISRHYYDAAMIAATGTGDAALSNLALLDVVREHNLTAFRQAWKRFDEAVPGSLRLVPQPEPLAAIERDYRAMRDMILGDAPPFEWIVTQLHRVETAINEA